MKLILSLLLAGVALPVLGATTNSELSVSIAVPYSQNTLNALGRHNDTNDTRVISEGCTFHIVVRNTSEKPQNLWEGGAQTSYSLRFELKDQHGKSWTVKKIYNGFFSGGITPVFWTLKPNETLVLDVCFSDDRKIWERVPHNETVLMRAVFEIKEDKSTKKFSVWTGCVGSDWNNYYFNYLFP